MNTSLRQWLTGLVLASLCVLSLGLSLGARAQNAEPPAPPAAAQAPAQPPAPAPNVEAPAVEAPAVEAPEVEAADADTSADTSSSRDQWREKWWAHRNWRGGRPDDLVSVGGDSYLAKGDQAETVVSVFGSSTSEGDVRDAVVSIFGDNHVSGTVGDSSVAVFGDNHVNAKVYGDVVAVMGDVELGPEAEVNGQVVVIGGTVKRDPNAVVNGGVQRVFGHDFGSFRWLRPWIQHCLLLGRPLALSDGLGWAWGLAFGFLALYTFIALLFGPTVDRCVTTLETRPGQTVVASLIGLLVTPVLFALLAITVIGIAFIPFAGAAMFVATMFGKVVVLAWIGRTVSRVSGESTTRLHTAVLVLIGGAVILVLYLIPLIGFIVYKALGILGFGVSVYAVILGLRARRAEASPPPAPPAGEPGPSGGSPAFGNEPYISGTAGGAAFAGGPDASANFTAVSDSATPSAETPGTGSTASSFESASTVSPASADAASAMDRSSDAAAASASGVASAMGAPSTGVAGTSNANAAAAAGAAGMGAANTAGAAGASNTGAAGIGAGGAGAPPGSGPSSAAPPPSGPAGVSAAVAPTLPKADFFVRMGALLIDVIIIALLLHTIRGGHDAQLIVLAIYGAIMWKVKGTTIGGIVFGLQVVRVDGRPIDWSTAIVRALSCFLSLVVVGLGFIWIAFDDQRQGWHDKIAGTVVVRVPKGVSLL